MQLSNTPLSITELIHTATDCLEHCSDTARLDAELLLADCLQKNRAYLYTWPEKIPEPRIQNRFAELIRQREQDIPVAYLTGTREFWSLPFRVSRETLIPRPETELLVQLALNILHIEEGPVLDLGTGCGAIAVSIASEYRSIDIDAVDQSAGALEIARVNASNNNVSVRFMQSDWYNQVPRRDYRLIVSNPPYIAEDDPHLNRDGLQHEPITALVSQQNGMQDIYRIISDARSYMQQHAWLLIEHGVSQGEQTRQLMIEAGFGQVRTELDIEQRDRVSLGQR